ncbi:MAG: VCBS repeat-containing protein [Planctomycetes bacterium]|nr:VCBS repeat-containing protein [Planctomycetota bacterium]
MDLDADGNLDLLSGSYSRHGQDMAGLFQVLWGEKGGQFRAAKALSGSDGKELLLPAGDSDEVDVERICTRPFAADLDGDGKLDLVAGNFAGTFAFFHGEGAGQFAPNASWLEAEGKRLSVAAHGDPFLIDWDADGDLDLLSGSAQGGAFLFANVGTRTAPRFAARKTLVEPAGEGAGPDELGDGHLQGPGGSTRVWCDDLNGDGKLDLLLGDNVTLYHAAAGVEPSVAQAKLGEWRAALARLMEQQADDWNERYEELEKARDAFVTEDRTGFVWVLYKK